MVHTAKKEKNISILSRTRKPFRDRIEAGDILAHHLDALPFPHKIVLGIPRGGMIIAQQIAKALKIPLDIVLSRKIGAPGHKELAIGSVSEEGETILNEPLRRDLQVSDFYIEEEKDAQLAGLTHSKQEYRRIKDKIPLAGKTVIVTDDGMATGSTLNAALWQIKREKPRKVIVALPVAPESEELYTLADRVDRMLVLNAPALFDALGRFYERFGDVSDEEVKEILRESYHFQE